MKRMRDFSNTIKLFFCICFVSLQVQAQEQRIRPLEELVNTADSGWPLVLDLAAKAKNKVELLPADSNKAKEALYLTQVTTRSPMGSIVYQSGGIFVDGGWIRILGSGHPRLDRTLPGWNKGKSWDKFGEPLFFLLIADDVLGGFFAINGGEFGADKGTVYYLAPDNLEWESMGFGYTDFLNFCFNGDLEQFYKGQRWRNWQTDIKGLYGNQAFSSYPFLWTKEGRDPEKISRKAVPVQEVYTLEMQFRKQMGLEK